MGNKIRTSEDSTHFWLRGMGKKHCQSCSKENLKTLGNCHLTCIWPPGSPLWRAVGLRNEESWQPKVLSSWEVIKNQTLGKGAQWAWKRTNQGPTRIVAIIQESRCRWQASRLEKNWIRRPHGIEEGVTNATVCHRALIADWKGVDAWAGAWTGSSDSHVLSCLSHPSHSLTVALFPSHLFKQYASNFRTDLVVLLFHFLFFCWALCAGRHGWLC